MALTEHIIEQLAAEVHNAWWTEKARQGFHPPTQCPRYPAPVIGPDEAHLAAFSIHCDQCHADMYPYASLPEHVKNYDRCTVRTVLAALDTLGYRLTPEEARPSAAPQDPWTRRYLCGCCLAGTDLPGFCPLHGARPMTEAERRRALWPEEP